MKFIIKEVWKKIKQRLVCFYEVCKQTGIKRLRTHPALAVFRKKEEAKWFVCLLNRLGVRANLLLRVLSKTEKNKKLFKKHEIRESSLVLMKFLPISETKH